MRKFFYILAMALMSSVAFTSCNNDDVIEPDMTRDWVTRDTTVIGYVVKFDSDGKTALYGLATELNLTYVDKGESIRRVLSLTNPYTDKIQYLGDWDYAYIGDFPKYSEISLKGTWADPEYGNQCCYLYESGVTYRIYFTIPEYSIFYIPEHGTGIEIDVQLPDYDGIRVRG